ncbi:hypothetical protein FSP39_022803 [Pinctada imbricata]|uniref:Ig-like domain-containing protein n=1 Tax=Pinctada imbricata TaxID=66713 RepID=A0AA88Y6J4_PINIB|nr:hypothetical protein FSP39_022803 [Pinctada imbricata]
MKNIRREVDVVRDYLNQYTAGIACNFLESNVKGVYAHFINITETGSDLGFLINSIPFLAHGQGGVWTIQVDDGGYPPLTDVTNAGFRVVYWSLSCSAADAELPCNHYALPITSIKCSTNIEGYKRYTVVDSAGIDLRIDENGNVFLNKSLSSLRPGLYDVTISVNIQRATPTLVNFTINVEAFRIANFTTEFNSSVKTRDIILNGTNIVLTCDVDVGHPEERVTVEWFLNTSRIRPTPSSRFVLGIESPFPCRRRYTMLIKPITDRDIGTYMCQVRGIYGQNASSLLHIQILSPPQLAIYPVTRSVIYGHRIEITCTILRPKGLAVEFKWLVDSKVVSEMDGIHIKPFTLISVHLCL